LAPVATADIGHTLADERGRNTVNRGDHVPTLRAIERRASGVWTFLTAAQAEVVVVGGLGFGTALTGAPGLM
jgi:hypothetical protein